MWAMRCPAEKIPTRPTNKMRLRLDVEVLRMRPAQKFLVLCFCLFSFAAGVLFGYGKGRDACERAWKKNFDETMRSRLCDEPGEVYICGQPEVWKYLPKQSETAH